MWNFNVKGEFAVLLLTALSACVFSQCPTKENNLACECVRPSRLTPELYRLNCYGLNDDIGKIFKRDIERNFQKTDKLEIKFRDFNFDQNLTSNLFQGPSIVKLEFEKCNIRQWADVVGGPAFVGQEDTLEELIIRSSISVPEIHEDYSKISNAFTISHLRRLKRFEVISNAIWNFDYKWFGEGGKSVENVIMVEDNIGAATLGWSSLSNLKQLLLSNNQLEKVERIMFPNPAFYLEYISLSGNKLTKLPRDIFENMPSLNRVEIERNTLHYIDERTWKPIWKQLEILMFDHNELYCDEKTAWLYKEKSHKHFDSGDCVKPSKFRGRNLARLLEEKTKKD